MVMDLDHFKEINDTLGHYHGDRLLQLVGERITSVLRARGHGGAPRRRRVRRPVCPSVPDRGYAISVAEKILAGLRSTFEIDGLGLEVGASIGIAAFPQHGEDKETLIQRADIAMYVAKADHSGVAALRDRAGPPLGPAPRARRRAAPRDRERRARPALPAEGRRRLRPGRRRRGAVPLAAPVARADHARRVRAAGRAHRPDHADDRAGDRPRPPADRATGATRAIA